MNRLPKNDNMLKIYTQILDLDDFFLLFFYLFFYQNRFGEI